MRGFLYGTEYKEVFRRHLCGSGVTNVHGKDIPEPGDLCQVRTTFGQNTFGMVPESIAVCLKIKHYDSTNVFIRLWGVPPWDSLEGVSQSYVLNVSNIKELIVLGRFSKSR